MLENLCWTLVINGCFVGLWVIELGEPFDIFIKFNVESQSRCLIKFYIQ